MTSCFFISLIGLHYVYDSVGREKGHAVHESSLYDNETDPIGSL
jgi:hypothetical protein